MESTHVGEYPASAPNCPPGSPAGREVVLGMSVTAVAAAATVTMTITVNRKVKLTCLVIPEGQGVNFNVISIMIADQQYVVGTGATVTNGTMQDVGVGGEAFAPWGTCANLIEGGCIAPGTPLAIAAINRSAAPANLKFIARGITVD